MQCILMEIQVFLHTITNFYQYIVFISRKFHENIHLLTKLRSVCLFPKTLTKAVTLIN